VQTEALSFLFLEKTRDAIYQGGVLEYMPAVLRSSDPEVLKKAAWALTNLSRSRASTFLSAPVSFLTLPLRASSEGPCASWHFPLPHLSDYDGL
jgi:hypothetical protein